MPILVKRGDTAPVPVMTVKDSEGVPVSLAGATVLFIMAAKRTREVVLSRVATVTDAAAGKVSLTWQPGETDTAGEYDVELQVTYAGGAIQSFPTRGYIQCTVIPDLG